MYLFSPLLESLLIHPFLQRAVILCFLSSILCALMGAVLMSGKTAFLGDALSHGMLPGITLGTRMDGPWWIVSLMGAVSGIILTTITLWTSRHRALDVNSSIAGIYLLAIAISMFFGGSEDLMHAFFGSIFIVPQSYVFVLTLCTLGSGIFCYYFWDNLKTHSFDSEFAYRTYPKMRWIYRGWIALFVLNAAIQFQGMGALVVLGLTILPFLSFYVSGTHLKHIFWKSVLWNMCATLSSLFFSCYKDWPYGPTLLIVLGIGYAGSLIYSRIKLPHLWRVLVIFFVSFDLYAYRPYIVTSSFLLKHITEKLTPKECLIETISENDYTSPCHCSSLHHFPCSAKSIKKLTKADLVILHGKGVDMQWISTLNALKIKAKILVLSEKIKLKKIEILEKNPIQKEISRTTFTDLISDGHLWHDPYYVIQYVTIITEALLKIYPNKSIQSRAAIYIRDLNDLDVWIQNQWKGRKKLSGLVFHNSMPYYQNRYGVTLYALPEASHHQGNYLMHLTKLKICAIFPEQSHSSEGAEQLAKDLKIKLASSLCIDDIPFGKTYCDVMKSNTEILCDALIQNEEEKSIYSKSKK
ncbi:manganese transport system membrane protein MntC [Holospora elegans E1]|uniref:Manganese transport system membrane protein MntC n=1 Tax=Holospora elegans E1 TaxID=1427503 RepID=A0A023DYT4_9PROT|nr:zinc ABC transporter substrate-binding protein [Holospora elegans]GAJ46674.1 manganese transport system membrane protein MntC [Holospora elegans E1]